MTTPIQGRDRPTEMVAIEITQPGGPEVSNSLDKHRFDQEITGNEKPSPINFPSIINTRLRE